MSLFARTPTLNRGLRHANIHSRQLRRAVLSKSGYLARKSCKSFVGTLLVSRKELIVGAADAAAKAVAMETINKDRILLGLL